MTYVWYHSLWISATTPYVAIVPCFMVKWYMKINGNTKTLGFAKGYATSFFAYLHTLIHTFLFLEKSS